MGSIFFFSSRARITLTEKSFVDFILFKSLHMIEYGFLYFLLFRALNRSTKFSTNRQLTIALIIAIIYAITDEVHQHFVPTRQGKVRDIFIDIGGIGFVFTYIKSHIEFVTKKLL
jgi:VanZ family protein